MNPLNQLRQFERRSCTGEVLPSAPHSLHESLPDEAKLDLDRGFGPPGECGFGGALLPGPPRPPSSETVPTPARRARRRRRRGWRRRGDAGGAEGGGAGPGGAGPRRDPRLGGPGRLQSGREVFRCTQY